MAHSLLQLVDGGVSEEHLPFRATFDDLIIIARARQCLQDAADGIDVSTGVHFRRAVYLLRGCVFVCTSRRVGVAVGIAIAQVYQLDIVVNARNEDVVGLKVKVYNLMAVQIANDAEQLLQKTVGVLAMGEIVGMMFDKLVERLAVDIVHQDAVVGLGRIAYQMRMVERIARLKLLLKSSHILRMGAQQGLQPFQEVQFTVTLHAVALTRSATYLQQLGIGKGLLHFRKRRCAVHHASKQFKVNALRLARREGAQALTVSYHFRDE